MIPETHEDKVAQAAHAMIRDFGGNALVDAHDALNAAVMAGDQKGADFLIAVRKKITEIYEADR